MLLQALQWKHNSIFLKFKKWNASLGSKMVQNPVPGQQLGWLTVLSHDTAVPGVMCKPSRGGFKVLSPQKILILRSLAQGNWGCRPPLPVNHHPATSAAVPGWEERGVFLPPAPDPISLGDAGNTKWLPTVVHMGWLSHLLPSAVKSRSLSANGGRLALQWNCCFFCQTQSWWYSICSSWETAL